MNWYKYKSAVKRNFSYGWTAVEFDKTLANNIINWGRRNIPDEEIYEKKGFGREVESHITLKYGLVTENLEIVKELLKDEKPVKATLGKIGYFSKNPLFDVCIIRVDSPDLHRINKKISDNLVTEDSFPVYQPHCTIAYLNKGEAHKYAGDTTFKDIKLTFNKIVFVNGDDERVEISLKK